MHELLPQVIFYVFAGLAVFSALMVVTQNNPVRCVLFLVLTFFASSILWMLAHAEFLALILVLVYVGAVMTLFLFVVMMLNIDVESMRSHFMRYLPFGLIIVALLTGLLLVAVPTGSFENQVERSLGAVNTLPDTQALGLVLYTDYVLAFELAAVILLVAIIAAITLAHRAPKHSKQQDVVGQIMTRSKDRIKLVNGKDATT